MQEISKTAYRYAALLYVVIGSYFWYLFYSLWLFLGKNVFPQDVSSVFSVQNSNFTIVNIAVASLLALVITAALTLHRKLRDFLIDVGDELTRINWPTLKEAQKSTALVLLLVTVVGFALFFADTLFVKVINAVMLSAA